MDRAEAQQWVLELCADLFVLQTPRLVVKSRRRGGYYKGWNQTIHMNLHSRRDPHNTLIHELAHHVRMIKMGRCPRVNGKVQRHGEDFYRALLLVSEAAEKRYGWEYNWMTEYTPLRRRRIFDKVAYARRLDYLKSLPQPCVAEEVEA